MRGKYSEITADPSLEESLPFGYVTFVSRDRLC